MADFGQYGFGNGKTVPKPDKLGGDVKKKILAVCILLAICLSVSYAAERFWDGNTYVICEYVGEKQNYRDWKQTLGDILYDGARGEYVRFVTKLSNDDVRLINKALQRYEVMKNEIYYVNTHSANGVGKQFAVLIKSKGQWDFVGVQYSY